MTPDIPVHVDGAVLLLSGGMDSTTVLRLLRFHGVEVDALVFDYGQTLRHEVQVATRNAMALGHAARAVLRRAPRVSARVQVRQPARP